MEDAESMTVGDRRDEQVDERAAMMPDSGELPLRVQGSLLDGIVGSRADRAE